MKRRYQIDQQRAVQQFRQLAREENPNIQMIFPMAEVVGLLQHRAHLDQLAVRGEPPAADVPDPARIDELFEEQPGLAVALADHRVCPLTACGRLDPAE